jgi:hypothetical protein
MQGFFFEPTLLPQGTVQSPRQVKTSMKSVKNTVNGLPTGASGPANVAAFKEG